jgi:hypothetical protein
MYRYRRGTRSRPAPEMNGTIDLRRIAAQESRVAAQENKAENGRCE